MTLIKSWTETGQAANGEVRWGLLQCDECISSRWPIGTVEAFRARGWRFDDFEAGPHYCPAARDDVDRADPPRRSRLPDFLVIGAMKCGTTSLYRYLDLHPEIQMSRRKELNFFQNPECLAEIDGYAANFDSGARLCGESSPIYTCHPITDGVPDRIAAAIPDVRLIYLVRDPVKRFISHYLQNRASGKDRRSADATINAIDSRYSPYMVTGRYATQIEDYLRVFDPEQLLVVDQSDLAEHRPDTLRRVFEFLDVDPDFVSPRFAERHRTADGKRELTGVGASLRRGRVAAAVRRMPERQRQALFKPVKRMLSRTLEEPALSEEAEQRLRGALRDEVGRLRELTGQEFATWRI